MRILKTILIVLAVIIAIPLIIALFVKKDFAIEREVVINKPQTEVFDYIKFLKNQDNFSKWNQLDPAMKKTYTGTDGTVGFIAAWESKTDGVGSGEQEIASIKEGERVDMKLRFKEPWEAQNDAYFITQDAGNNSTKVIWGFKGVSPYPFNIFGLFMNMDKMIGDDLNIGLENLKKVLETQHP